MSADTVAGPGILSEGRIPRSTIRLTERPAFGLIIATLASLAAFTYSGQLKLLETEVNDQLRVVLPHHAAEQDKRISIVTLTEETLIQFPYRSPVDRGFLAELLTFLDEVGVKGVVFDILFDQPTEPEKDAALIAAMRAFDGPIVAAWGNEEAGLMKRFYGQLKSQDSTFATALRNAQSELRNVPATSHPIFWGPFVLIGDGAQTLNAEKSANASTETPTGGL